MSCKWCPLLPEGKGMRTDTLDTLDPVIPLIGDGGQGAQGKDGLWLEQGCVAYVLLCLVGAGWQGCFL